MMYEYGMLLRCFLVWESKSYTVAEDSWEAESFISAGDDERRLFARDLLFLSEDILSGIDSSWEYTLWREMCYWKILEL